MNQKQPDILLNPTTAEIKAYIKQFIPDTYSYAREEGAPDCTLSYGSHRPPKCNHSGCWDYYFEQRPGVLVALEKAIDTYGYGPTEASVGSKFVKHYRRYLKEHDGRN